MIYIATAMREEAKKIIEYYNLKKDSSVKKFQVFRNDNVTLFITGIGFVNGLVATTHLLTIENINSSDILVNIGIGGAKDPKRFQIGDVVVTNKVIDRTNEIEFYPDMVFAHSFKEGTLETFLHPCTKSDEMDGDIADMEGAGVVKAGSYFMDSSQIFVLKIVSDYLEFKNPIDVDHLIESNMIHIDSWLRDIDDFLKQSQCEYDEDERKTVEKFMERLRFTKSMESECLTLIKYWKLSGKNVNLLLGKYIGREIKEKKEVKKILDEIRKTVIQ